MSTLSASSPLHHGPNQLLADLELVLLVVGNATLLGLLCGLLALTACAPVADPAAVAGEEQLAMAAWFEKCGFHVHLK